VASTYRKQGAGLDTNAWNLRRLLEDEPFAVGFFQALQLLERIYPDRQPVGLFEHPSREVVRLTAHTRLGFPASDVQSIHWPPEGAPVMAVNFFGLTGPNGVLPHLYTLLLIERRFARDRRLQDFLDIFHHRMLSLYYQAWRKYRVAAGFGSDEHRVTWYLKDLAGIGTKGLEDRQEVPDRSLLYFSGLLALQPRSAVGFEHLLREFFGAPVEIQQFAGAWYDLPLDAQCELIDEEGSPRQLGLGAVAGDQIWDHSSKARIRIGPMPLERYRQFFPGTPTHNALRALARFYTAGQIDFDVQLVLAREQVPEYELGTDGAELPLGLCSWAKTGDFEHDPDDAILSLGDESWV
jgi:type VI secretion system protein ImpH